MTSGKLKNKDAVEKSLHSLLASFMRILGEEHYLRLARLDTEKDTESDDIMRFLLFNSVVLEYNDYWREVNPIVKDSDEFKRALKAYEKSRKS